ncbi:MAG: excinuclease ABC subunit UvrC [Chloroflexi bacterium]|nr:excinuclease ABC subunit UvrC [Chloroflexota bacterium]
MDASRASQLLAATPTKPGVYIMKDAQGKVLYVGKAINLRSRLRSYFGSPGEFTIKLMDLMPRVADYEYIVTDSEAEALLLENTLIKRDQPRFNIRLKDDKNYPYIKIDLQEAFPRLDITRRVKDDGARYFGPFASASSMRKTMALLKRLFPYRSCTKAITGKDDRPCLEYHIKRCVAPCVGYATKEEYGHVIDQVLLFLDGRQGKVLRELHREMDLASQEMRYERAASLRDQIRAIERVAEEQKVVSLERDDQDIVAVAQADDEAWVEVFFIRHGKLTGRDNFILAGTRNEDPQTILGEFVKQYYPTASHVPAEVLLQYEPPGIGALTALVSDRRGRPVGLKVPQRGERKRLVNLVARNAKEGLDQRRVKWLADKEKVSAALDELQEQLSLPAPPGRIETYDISNIRGTNAVGSMVVFQDGQSKRSHYRRFKIRGVEGIDDYAMMQEMIRRRFGKLGRGSKGNGAPSDSKRPSAAKDDKGWGILPDLVLIDGGKGHLNAVLEVMLELGLANVPLASVAKQEEEVFIPEMAEPINLPRNSQGLYLIQRMRDEAHRFAVTYHRALRSKEGVRSAMDDVTGIGPKRKKALLRQFGSVQAVRDAPVDEIAAVVGMTRSLADRVKSSL